jgi:hypothetical protein
VDFRKGIVVERTPKIRSQFAIDAALRVGGPMKDRRTPREGSRNSHSEYLEGAMEEMACDFCGIPATTVRRIVLDSGYNRSLGAARYACWKCSEEKEYSRLGYTP